jgi:hypothetical protein
MHAAADRRSRIRSVQGTLLLLVAASLLAGCGSGHAARASTSDTARASIVLKRAPTTVVAPGTPPCAFYGVTIALSLLRQHDRDLPSISKLQPAWQKLAAEAANAGRLFVNPTPGLRPLAPSYKTLLATINAASITLEHGDTNAFRTLIQGVGPSLRALSRGAGRAHLKCTIRSADGSTMTFGG